MRTQITLMACLLLALAFFTPPAHGNENQIWWTSAEAEAEREGYGLIDDRTLGQRVKAGEEMLILDARADYEFAAGHIPGAVNMEFDLGDRTDLSEDKRQKLGKILGPDKTRTVIIYCRSFR